MTFHFEDFLKKSLQFKHHALLLLNPKISARTGIQAIQIVEIAKQFCEIYLQIQAYTEENKEAAYPELSPHPDVITIGGERATLRMDDVASIEKYAPYPPLYGRKRLFVIDRCDRLNNSAANALLKIIEEPAIPCLFLLTSQRLQKVLPTIASRCQKVNVCWNIVEAEKTDFDTTDQQNLEVFFKLVQSTMSAQNSEQNAHQHSPALWKKALELSDILVKKYSATEILDALATFLSKSCLDDMSAVTLMRSRLAEMRQWRDALTYNVNPQQNLLRILMNGLRQ